MKNRDGVLLLTIEEIRERWREHYGGLASDETGHSRDMEYWEKLDPEETRNTVIDGINDPIVRTEVWDALKLCNQ